MQTSDSGSVSGSGNKAGSKKNARVEEEGMGGISHERLVNAQPIYLHHMHMHVRWDNGC